jgi:hypothetical protein
VPNCYGVDIYSFLLTGCLLAMGTLRKRIGRHRYC